VATRLKNIPPEQIQRNPENPRMHFREAGLNKLAESVEESGGVLVPVYVYPDPSDKKTNSSWLTASAVGERH
jgi:ParB-like chromosome segregation protein Spo0J